jgi:hypothetical protein
MQILSIYPGIFRSEMMLVISVVGIKVRVIWNIV